MNTFRVTKKDSEEIQRLKTRQPGALTRHGVQEMAMGQRHYTSTAVTYSGHLTDPKVEGAGGLITIRGRSGRYISPFGAQSTFADGGEILYPPGMVTRYQGPDPHPYQAKPDKFPVYGLLEMDPSQVGQEPVEDENFGPSSGTTIDPNSVSIDDLKTELVRMSKTYGALPSVDLEALAAKSLSGLDQLRRRFKESVDQTEITVRRQVWEVIENNPRLKQEVKKGLLFPVQGTMIPLDYMSPMKMRPEELDQLFMTIRELDNTFRKRFQS